jgi:hypothetical protein
MLNMHRSKGAIVVVATVGIFSGSLAQAQVGGTGFSAEIIQRGPEGQESTGKMFVGKDRIRTDMNTERRGRAKNPDRIYAQEPL